MIRCFTASNLLLAKFSLNVHLPPSKIIVFLNEGVGEKLPHQSLHHFTVISQPRPRRKSFPISWHHSLRLSLSLSLALKTCTHTSSHKPPCDWPRPPMTRHSGGIKPLRWCCSDTRSSLSLSGRDIYQPSNRDTPRDASNQLLCAKD